MILVQVSKAPSVPQSLRLTFRREIGGYFGDPWHRDLFVIEYKMAGVTMIIGFNPDGIAPVRGLGRETNRDPCSLRKLRQEKKKTIS